MVKINKSDWIMILASIVIVAGTIFVLEQQKTDDTSGQDQGTEAPTEEEKPVDKEESELIPGGDESAEDITL